VFTVHLHDKGVKFVRSPNGLRHFNPPYNKNQQACAINVPMDNVKEDLKMFTNCQNEWVKARKVIHVGPHD
jgi:hypothetical protein